MIFNLNKQQKEIIKCFEDNGICFVNASAGTGKTSTITELYLKLLEQKEKVSNIAVITFTKAAANEMLFRIRLKVRNKINEIKKNNKSDEKKYWENVYKEILTNSKISTINSFANSIVMENAMKLSIPPNALILEDNTDIKEALKEEILNTLREAENAEKIRYLYRISTEESKNIFVSKILNFLITIKPRLENIDNFEKKALEVLYIEDKYKKEYDKLIFITNSLINNDGPDNNTIKNFKTAVSNSISYITKLSDLQKVINNNEIEEIKYIINNIQSIPNRCGNKNIEFKENINSLKESYSKILNYIDIKQNEKNYKIVISFIKEAYIRFEKLKKDMGVYSYEDIMYKAVEALENNEISKEIRDNISVLILDEAQDTSNLQFDFINLIIFGKKHIESENKTNKKLMIVGDKKQSIYRFRNANFKAFLDMQNSFKKYVRYLKDNYRSNSMLINFFNDIFQNTVFADDPIGYNDDDNLQYNKKNDNKSVSILVLNNNIKDDNIKLYADDKAELEAYSIAKYIKKYYNNDYKNTVILLQTSTKLNKYLQALSDLDIPYYIDGGNGFYERQEIEIIKTFLEYLILRDHSKLPAILRSELFDLNISDLSDFLFSLFINGLDIKDYFPIRIYDNEKHSKIEEIAKSKTYYTELLKAKELLNSIEIKVNMLNSSDIIETICADTNYYNYLMTLNDAELSYANIEKLKMIANNFENQTGKNIYDFVLNLKNVNNNESYSSIPKLSVEAVKIMTVHKSKGLEFNNVFLAGIGHYYNTISNDFDFIDDSPLIKIPVYAEDKYYQLDFSLLTKDYDKESTKSEKKRLLYVALTRASNNLILSGESQKGESYRKYINDYCDNLLKDYNDKVYSEKTYELNMIENFNNEFINAYSYGIGIKPKEIKYNNIIDIKNIKQKINNTKIKNTKDNNEKIIENILPSAKNNKNKSFINISEILDRRISELENEINDNNDYNENIEFLSYQSIGTIIHKMLEYFDFNKYKKEKEKYLEKIKSYILKSNNHYNKQQLIDSIDTAFDKLFENKHIDNILKGIEEIVSREHTLQHYNGKKIITGKIDIITKINNEYFILDYKVSAYSNEKIDFYKAQLDNYKYMFGKAFDINEKNIKTDIIFLK